MRSGRPNNRFSLFFLFSFFLLLSSVGHWLTATGAAARNQLHRDSARAEAVDMLPQSHGG